MSGSLADEIDALNLEAIDARLNSMLDHAMMADQVNLEVYLPAVRLMLRLRGEYVVDRRTADEQTA